MRSALGKMFIGVSVAAVVLGAWLPTTYADVSGSIALGATSIAPGDSTTVDTTFAESIVVLPGTVVSIKVTAGPASTGTVTLSAAVPSIDFFGCVAFDATQIDCIWKQTATTGTVSVTATASGDASGQFNITTFLNQDPQGTTVETGVQGPSVLTVALPATTTTAPAGTTTVATTAAPSSTVVGGAQLPGTGSTHVPLQLAIGVSALGVTLAALARRRARPTV